MIMYFTPPVFSQRCIDAEVGEELDFTRVGIRSGGSSRIRQEDQKKGSGS